MESVDVCIIGGGMAGASIAYRIAREAKVLLLEREPHVAYHSTGRSAALFHPQYGSTVIRALTAASGSFYESPPAEFGAILSPRGSLVIGRDGQDEALAKHERLAAASGQTITRLSTDQVVELVPQIRPDAAAWGLYDTLAMDMDVEVLLQGFLRGARRDGMQLVTGAEVTAIRRAGTRWRVVTLDREIDTQVVVNAAGAWVDATAELAGLAPLNLIPYRRTAFTFDAPPGVDAARWPMIIDADEQFYVKPDAGRVLGSLSEEVASPPCDIQPDDLDVAIAVDRIESAMTFPINRVIRAWAGLRTFGPDRNPVSGFEDSAPGFYWHGAIGGYGIQTAAALGAFAAAMIAGRELPAELAGCGVRAAELAPARLRS
jgi:D-arginine dehydrogenase